MSEAELIPTPLLSPAGGVPDLIESEIAFSEAIEKLSKLTGPIAVDAERASGYRYSARAYLIQIKRGSEIFLIDPIPFIGSELITKLNAVIQSDEVIKLPSTRFNEVELEVISDRTINFILVSTTLEEILGA